MRGIAIFKPAALRAISLTGAERKGRTPTPPLPRRAGGGSGALSFSMLLPGITLAAAVAVAVARAQVPKSPQAQIMDAVGFDQNLGARIPMDVAFTNDDGARIALADLAAGGRRPIVFALVYYRCPMLCDLTLNALTDSLSGVGLTAGDEYQFVALSIDPDENALLAAEKKRNYLDRYGETAQAGGWSFLTGDEASIRGVADAVGFHYMYDERIGEYAHPAGFVILTPSGEISHYFYGIQYRSRDIRFALIEASSGRIGSPIDQLLLMCYHYDPTTGKYGLLINNSLRVAGSATVAALASMIFVLIRREQRGRRGKRGGGGGAPRSARRSDDWASPHSPAFPEVKG